MLLRVIFVGGKGGVGKSTISSAIAYKLSRKNQKTLLISTDPAHNLEDIFDIKIDEAITKASDNLDILQIDSKYETKKFLDKVAANSKEFVNAHSYELVNNFYESIKDSSTSEESACFERLVSEININSNYENIVIDTAPTGHTLRLLKMPQALKKWSQNLLNFSQKGAFYESIVGVQGGGYRARLLEILNERCIKYQAFCNILEKKAEFFWVINPAKLSINESFSSLETLPSYMQKSSKIIVNKILPSNSADEFLAQRIRLQKEYLEQIKVLFKNYEKIEIPLFADEILRLKSLEKLGEFLP